MKFWYIPKSKLHFLFSSIKLFEIISSFETEDMESQTVRVRTCNLKKNFMAPFYGWGSTVSRLEPLRGNSQVHSWYIHLTISKITGKTEHGKHVVRNITISEAAGQYNNITEQTTSEQVLFYLNVHLLATIVSIHGIWEVGGRGEYTPLPPLVSQLLEMRRDGALYQGYPLCNNDDQ